MSDTPRTDAAIDEINHLTDGIPDGDLSLSLAKIILKTAIEKLRDKAKELEVELTEANAALRTYNGEFRRYRETEQERDQLRAEVERLKQSCLNWATGVEQSNTDVVDLHRDEFRRIMILTDNTEIIGLCERAIAAIEQKVPVIIQRDQLQAEIERLKAELHEARMSVDYKCKCERDQLRECCLGFMKWEELSAAEQIKLLAAFEQLKGATK